MKSKQIILTFLLYAVISNYSQAGLLGMEVYSNTVSIGDKVSAIIKMDFSDVDDESLGGTFQLSYDNSVLRNPVFNFENDVLLTSFGIQSDVSSYSNNEVGKLNITFGTFDFSKGVSGKGILGYLIFDSFGLGDSGFKLNDYQGGFYSFSSFQQQQIEYQTASLNVVSNAVPIPSGALLFAGGLSGMGLVIRRGKKTRSI